VSPFLMEASLVEVTAGTLGHVLVYRPNEWRAAIFQVYYRKVAEHARLFPIFHSFETAFRSTLAVAFENHYGHPRWWRAVYETVRNGKNPKTVTQVGSVKMTKETAFIIGKVIDAQSDIATIGTFNNGYEFLECCTLSHMRRLIEEHWGVFSPRFSRANPRYTLADFTAKFDRVRNARNDVYHHKSVAGMSDVVTTAEELLDHLDFCMTFVYSKITDSSAVAPTFSIQPGARHRIW
jgi:hypothetical protein